MVSFAHYTTGICGWAAIALALGKGYIPPTSGGIPAQLKIAFVRRQVGGTPTHCFDRMKGDQMSTPKTWEDAVRGLHHGDFSYLEPLFDKNPSSQRGHCRIIEWFEEGRFANDPKALAEALSCACFLGRTTVAEFLLDQGVDPATGNGTGLNAVHWAANRGNLETVKLLIGRGAPLEIENMYGGTVLDCALWSSIYEPCVDHVSIIEALIEAGAKADVIAAEWLRPDLQPPLDPRVAVVLRRAVMR